MRGVKFRSELDAALSAVRQASIVCRHVQAGISPDVLEKRDRSPVTIADFASQAVVCKVLDAAFPKDPVVAEEDSAALAEPDNASFIERISDAAQLVDASIDEASVRDWIDRGAGETGASRFWTLDPIDGTKGFLRGGQYAVSLALLIDGQIQVAAVACPNLPVSGGGAESIGALLFAVRGDGAWIVALDDPADTSQPSSIRVTSTEESTAARFCESVESGHSAHDVSASVAGKLGIQTEPVRMDSQAKYAAVARGDADIYMRLPTRADYREKIWDHAGGALIVEEAGGRVSDIDGKPLDWTHGRELTENRGVIVTNGFLHNPVIRAIADTGAF